MLLAIVSWKRIVSWRTMPIWRRRLRSWTSRMSLAVDPNRARVDVPEPRQQVHQGRLAAAVGADQRDAFRRGGPSG